MLPGDCVVLYKHGWLLRYHIFLSAVIVRVLYTVLVCVQYEMLTGSLPFQGENRKATMTMILK